MADLDRQKIYSLHASELESFIAERPQSAERLERARRSMPSGVPMPWMSGLHAHPPLFAQGGKGAYFTDIDGHRYLDMNHADMSMSCGFAPQSVVDAVSEQVARGSQFLLPTEVSIEVSELLADRFELPFWQYTLSATSANTEAIRIARAATVRSSKSGNWTVTTGHSPSDPSLSASACPQRNRRRRTIRCTP